MGFFRNLYNTTSKVHNLTLRVELLLTKVGKVIMLLQQEENRMSQVSDAITRLTSEVRDQTTLNGSILTLVQGFPDVVRKAVDDALAANPSLSASDLQAINDAADELDRGQQELIAAIPANTSEPTPEVPEVPPATETVPETFRQD